MQLNDQMPVQPIPWKCMYHGEYFRVYLRKPNNTIPRFTTENSCLLFGFCSFFSQNARGYLLNYEQSSSIAIVAIHEIVYCSLLLFGLVCLCIRSKRTFLVESKWKMYEYTLKVLWIFYALPFFPRVYSRNKHTYTQASNMNRQMLSCRQMDIVYSSTG